MGNLLDNDKVRLAAGVAAVLAIMLLGWILFARFTGGPASAAGNRVFIDAETGQTFRHTLSIGDQIPLESPYTGQRTAYEAEACYWTADGGTKEEPTWVLPRDRVEPGAGPTFCPDCDRLVTQLNPAPDTGVRPPPTRPEYELRLAERSRQRSGNRPQAQPDDGHADPRTASGPN